MSSVGLSVSGGTSPPRIKYIPLYEPVFSTASRSSSFSRIIMIEVSRVFDEQISHKWLLGVGFLSP